MEERETLGGFMDAEGSFIGAGGAGVELGCSGRGDDWSWTKKWVHRGVAGSPTGGARLATWAYE